MKDDWQEIPGDSFRKAIVRMGKVATGRTVAKNEAYGDAIHATTEILRILYPAGVSVDRYPDLLLIVRVLDKINRISQGDKRSFDESPWDDIAGYGILGSAKDHYDEQEKNSKVTTNGIRDSGESGCGTDHTVPAGHRRIWQPKGTVVEFPSTNSTRVDD